jgi:hypothetical protein
VRGREIDSFGNLKVGRKDAAEAQRRKRPAELRGNYVKPGVLKGLPPRSVLKTNGGILIVSNEVIMDVERISTEIVKLYSYVLLQTYEVL